MTESLITVLIKQFLKIGLLVIVVITGVAYLTLAERKISAWIQDRVGPNRVGPWGLLQPLADGVKHMYKEEVIPLYVNKPLYILAPMIILFPAVVVYGVIPFGDVIELMGLTVKLQIADLNIGILYIIAVTSLGVYGIVIGGWASYSKYSFLGGLRSAAQMISYELSLGLALIGVLILTESLKLSAIVDAQSGSVFNWYVFRQPLGFLLFMIASFAETNRLPFDFPEAEQELVGGYHTEYSSMKFSMFFIAEYMNMIAASAMMATLFLGGWSFPGLSALSQPWYGFATIAVITAKTVFFLFIFLWVRWTLPRFRYDKLMTFGWKVVLPLALANVLVTAFVVVL